uniref:Uncharacterized protein n=1 Tax=Trypanosoma vivax (strain Y486) TaxID=1055687 RepID=G0TZW9_TRYVY|nr:hypothetical protein TVY486_0807540 [Trypanosoma vivax Y486]
MTSRKTGPPSLCVAFEYPFLDIPRRVANKCPIIWQRTFIGFVPFVLFFLLSFNLTPTITPVLALRPLIPPELHMRPTCMTCFVQDLLERKKRKEKKKKKEHEILLIPSLHSTFPPF